MAPKEFYGLILAAGMGKRLRSAPDDDFPKVLREVNGRWMVSYVLDALQGAGTPDICVVVGVGAELVKLALGDTVQYALQPEALGSGHAAACAKELLEGKSQHVIVMCGDSPLFTAETVADLKREHLRRNAVITLVSAEVDDPTGYGRIVRPPEAGEITAIVEEKAASPEEKLIREINGGSYAFDSDWLWSNIGRIRVNDTGELYLTDMVRFAIDDGCVVASVRADADEILGVNTPEQLKQAEDILRARQQRPA